MSGLRTLALTILFFVQLADVVEGRVKGIFSRYSNELVAKECTCNCCIRELRRPAERTASAKFKCALAPPNDDRVAIHGCQDTCTVINDPIFPQAETLEMNRFCFFHCQPTGGGRSTAFNAAKANQERSALVNGGNLLDSECVSIRAADLKKAYSADGNGKDAHLQAAR
eukprot:TRINITY_DN108979_c0_g1_i1.p1 TRINITY_DN108979_c0_g1~~TRINITY_DN108979_c0_g1_i1.p1  ORF type:complete len:169 (-),score=38.57 TRINITY_DN108979_c0_g1_i1:129-635(-)